MKITAVKAPNFICTKSVYYLFYGYVISIFGVHSFLEQFCKQCVKSVIPIHLWCLGNWLLLSHLK